MLYYITLTTICSLNCRYCGNYPDPKIQPSHLSVPIEDIKKFILMDPEPIICFYGGEPLLRLDLIYKIIDSIPAKKFILQTDGLLLHKIASKYLNKLDVILVSIDGRKDITDYYRGKGVYERVISNVKLVREREFKGEIIARMAVSGKTDIYQDVKHLVELEDPCFDYVHWQLDVMWDYPPYQRYDNFNYWVKYIYNPGISKLIRYWVNELYNGRFRRIIPFMSIMYTLLTDEKIHLRCGSGINAFAITTDGKILACPIAPEFKFNYLGDIYNSTPHDLPYKIMVGEPCTSCEYYHICGGRCLFANKTKLWGKDGFTSVCKTVTHLINELMKIKNKIKILIEKGYYTINDFKYPKYPNTVEIIP